MLNNQTTYTTEQLKVLAAEILDTLQRMEQSGAQELRLDGDAGEAVAVIGGTVYYFEGADND
jgi:hypothetical protein